ncbi:restriction endonuclease subunit S [Bacteroides ovatus]|uniref:Restriction endonuclease subunit S n=1 Tax=Bacteroides ovatus TaxID=28116 RepID=A0A641PPY6_BACOV|nr:restriction endonuclease subunit S [Bacteroides ovatus]
MANNNNKDKCNVPPLRFPEFSGEWEEHTLSEYLEFKNGLNPDAKRIGQGLPFISVMDILAEGVITYNSIRGKVEATDKEIDCFGVKNGDLLFQRSSETLEDVGRANVYMDSRTAVYGGFVIRGRKIGNYVPLFFKYLLATPLARKKTCRMGAGAQHFNIGQEGLSKISLSFPSVKEQEKIANLLSLIDERIATQNKIIYKLKSLIRGIMVELQKRGLSNGTWKKVLLSNVLTERNELNKSLYPVYSVSVIQGIVNQMEYLGRSFAASDTSKYHVVHYGDLVYTKSPTGSFPYGIIKQSYNQNEVAVSPLYGVYEPKTFSTGVFLHEYFKSELNTLNYLHPLVQKGAKNTINIANQRFLESYVAIPSNANELLAISKLLCSLNTKLEFLQNILKQSQGQKQYLLRQMFI